MKDISKFLDKNIISALAIDQRDSLRKMLDETNENRIKAFKQLVSEHLTPYSSSILLDPEYGLEAANHRNAENGLLISYEQSGYDKNVPGRRPYLLDDWSVNKLKSHGAEAIKLLVYVDPDEDDNINEYKQNFIQRVGSECKGENIPLFLEIKTYDANIKDTDSREYAGIKPQKVFDVIKEFSKEKYAVDIFKLEIPVNMNFVEGHCEYPVYTRETAANYFRRQSDLCGIPFIFLSAGVSTELFIDTLKFARQSGSEFNGVLCGRATWSDAADVYKQDGLKAVEHWLKEIGTKNISELNKAVKETATPIK